LSVIHRGLLSLYLKQHAQEEFLMDRNKNQQRNQILKSTYLCSTIADLIRTYGVRICSLMTGCWRRLSDSPPNMATSGLFPSRLMVSLRLLRGPSGVFSVAFRRVDSFITLVWFLLARVLRSDVSIVYPTYPRFA